MKKSSNLEKLLLYEITKHTKADDFDAEAIFAYFRANRVRLTLKQIKSVREQLKGKFSQTFSLEFSDRQIATHLKRGVDIASIFTEDFFEKARADALSETASGLTNKLANSEANKLHHERLISYKKILLNRHAHMRDFYSSISEVWGDSLDLLETFISLCVESAQNKLNALPFKISGAQRDALAKLHGRACQVSYEVCALWA